jgi:hypothetical protein
MAPGRIRFRLAAGLTAAGALGRLVVGVVLVVAPHPGAGRWTVRARVVALIAIWSGSWAGSIQRNTITMLVSSMRCWGCSAVRRAAELMVECGVVIGTKRVRLDRGSVA